MSFSASFSSCSSLNDVEDSEKPSLRQVIEYLNLPSLCQSSVTSDYSSISSDENISQSSHLVDYKTLIEAQNRSDSKAISSTKLLSTPSIVVSDYSDDVSKNLDRNVSVDDHIIRLKNLSLTNSSSSSLNCSSGDESIESNENHWIQLAGHKNRFCTSPTAHTILKMANENERFCFQKMSSDTLLKRIIPSFKGVTIMNNISYIEMEDLLYHFENPCVMDCKIGVRTILEDELLKANEIYQLRGDMYSKMMEIDPKSPTNEEHLQQAVSKSRYMLWRESVSSTSTYGFRIEGIKLSTQHFSNRHLKLTKSIEDLSEMIRKFIDGYDHASTLYLKRLLDIKSTLINSEFFRRHEFIGSSLLFVHDRHDANIWLIDFAKTIPVPENMTITHKEPWNLGNHEDGYLTGLNNIIKIFQNITHDLF